MGILRNVPRECFGIRAVVVFTLTFVTILLAAAGVVSAANVPKTVAEIALYRGPDRAKILVDGARKEGAVTIYYSNTGIKDLVQGFAKKYPFIRALSWRSSTSSLLTKVKQEYAKSLFNVDVLQISNPVIDIIRREGILQEYTSPNLVYYGDEAKTKGKTGVFYSAVSWSYHGLGFNTERVSPAEAPRNLKDLLDPRWKGKISITADTTGVRFIGNALDAMGLDFIEKLSQQDVKIHNIAGAAVAGLVASGEVALCPTSPRDDTLGYKKKGAPIEWRPLEPVVTNSNYSGITSKSPHPCAAMLFIDYISSQEGQKLILEGGLSSPRADMASPETTFKKTIFDKKYSSEDLERKHSEWEKLLKTLFIHM